MCVVGGNLTGERVMWVFPEIILWVFSGGVFPNCLIGLEQSPHFAINGPPYSRIRIPVPTGYLVQRPVHPLNVNTPYIGMWVYSDGGTKKGEGGTPHYDPMAQLTFRGPALTYSLARFWTKLLEIDTPYCILSYPPSIP